MDSCILATVDEGRVVTDLSGESAVKDSNEVEVTSLEEAKSVIAALRARQRAQAQQMLAWRRTLKLQASFNYTRGRSFRERQYREAAGAGVASRRVASSSTVVEIGRSENARNDRSELLPP